MVVFLYMQTFKEKVLDHFALTADDYSSLTKEVSSDDLPNPASFHNFAKFITRIEEAITKGENILIYGDYDADGILATSVVLYALQKRGANVNGFIPSRYKEGYGLNINLLERFKARNVSLIITVDNGISAHEAILKANELGIDVLVSDHHEIGATLPEAYAILHPHLTTNEVVATSGGYMGLVISYGLLGKYDDYALTLAGISVIADMMPLVSFNRTIARLTIANLNKNKYQSLLLLNEDEDFDEDSISLKIVPKINALGRLSKEREANVLLEYFLTDNVLRLKEINLYLTRVNEERKALSQNALSSEDVNTDKPAIIALTNELEGIIGLIAQGYVTRYHKPSIVFTPSLTDSSVLKGSARSNNGFSIVDAFNKLSDLIIVSGGHEQAGGLSIKKDNFIAFKEAFERLVAVSPLKPVRKPFININKEELTKDNYAFLRTLSPFGVAFANPIFRISDFNVSDLSFLKDKNHIITPLPTGVKIVGFNVDNNVRNEEKVSFLGQFRQNKFKNFININFQITEFE